MTAKIRLVYAVAGVAIGCVAGWLSVKRAWRTAANR